MPGVSDGPSRDRHTRDQKAEQDKAGKDRNNLAKAASGESVIHLETDQGNEHFVFVLRPISDHYVHNTPFKSK